MLKFFSKQVLISFNLFSSVILNQQINNHDQVWADLGLSNFDKNRLLNRGEFAIIVDYFLNPFENFKVNFKGELVQNEQ